MSVKMKSIFNKLANRETISYIIFGVLTTVVNYVVNYLCYYQAGLSTFISNIIAWVISVIFAFFVNKIFVFESRSWKPTALFREFYTFIAARLLSLAFEEVFMVVTVDYVHVENWIAKILSNVFVVIMNYFASKFIIFKKGNENNAKDSND